MRQRRLLRFHSLKRGRVRQTWNKHNLFNLLNYRNQLNTGRTLFQQKWAAKSVTRAYHGEHISEGKWERMFSRRLLSAVDMAPAYMARHDGSEQAAGRGSGKILSEDQERFVPRNGRGRDAKKMTPYMQMTFAPQERRLDVAIHRAMFASSARQARQFVIHGAVTVNGKKMKYPGYMLNPGDLFQVNPDRVMTATGLPKPPTLAARQKALKVKAQERAEQAAAAAEAAADETPASPSPKPSSPPKAKEPAEPISPEEAKKQEIAELRKIQDKTKWLISSSKGQLSAKHKIAIRSLQKQVKKAMSAAGTQKGDKSVDTVESLSTLLVTLQLTPVERKAEEAAAAAAAAETESYPDPVTEEEQDILRRLIEEEKTNPWDPSKPYMTPWRPRPFMAPFAFIPRYLEVNHKICAAVYLRHPVARPGKTEVPTPFNYATSQLAFNWYLRRS
ncbi:alpha-L RNA-binding motif-containing protein [Cladorrhinum samala]|uniref:Small ribosomal subunit protein uS4m n=1 Tax=Cladorrhinum samala TaxID=585594 RepID=A0AAV9HVI9_9PEZI|nr:alpha-L RNA-binding motif-containing protein [Cladorrhinum samala]